MKTWTVLAGVAVLAGGCSPRDFRDKASDIQLWAQRGFAASQANYGDSWSDRGGGGGGYARSPQAQAEAKRAAVAAAAAAEKGAARPPPPQQRYVVIMP
ncbi:hypothetical protein [Phenylobacterium sp.]|uniref:hypothetical protein n=1 Tax=Phenylobacterium sp. TaxID=1871053 RepID=UPI00289D85C9|nr:hypothetical protein [Phenylobacterium sp.]